MVESYIVLSNLKYYYLKHIFSPLSNSFDGICVETPPSAIGMTEALRRLE
jgi:hypothetical protein